VLTADLVRATVRKEMVLPRWVDPTKEPVMTLAERVVGVFADAVGRQVASIREALADIEAEHPEPLLVKGFAKLVWDGAELATVAAITPTDARRAVFAAARAAWPVRPGGGEGFTARETVMAEVAGTLGVTVAELEASLFADRGEEQRVTSIKPLAAVELANKYNMALAQACLLRAREARIEFKSLDNKRLRAILRAVKFHRLIARATRDGDTLRLWMDGPLSLHHQTGRYGLQLAQMLPAIARTESWSLEADVVWHRGAKKGVPAVFRLSQDSPIGERVAHDPRRDAGVWRSPEEQLLRQAMETLKTPWTLEEGLEVFDLGGRDVLTPDFRLVHPDGRQAFVEIIWTWRQRNVEQRLALLKTYAPPGLIVAWARRGGVEGAIAELDIEGSYGFKGVISAKELIRRAELVAVTGATTAKAAKDRDPKRRSRKKPTD